MIMAIVFLIIKVFKYIKNTPKRIKKKVNRAIDNTIDRAYKRNPNKKNEEHRHYYDIKILNVNDKK